MAGPILSNWWYRVAALKPKLRSHARLHRHRYRGELWYLLQDPISSRVHRFTPAARMLIAAMDGKRNVEDLWELANRRLGENAPSQDEIIQLLGQLHNADLLVSNVTPDALEVFERGERQDKARRRRSFSNPMAVRIHLWDPEKFLNASAPNIAKLWGRGAALLWLAVVLPALILIPPNWAELTNNFSDRVLAAENLLLLWLIFPLIKALHEMGHAVATKAGGGEVHDMGIMLLVLMPVPYVEASASTVFKSKYQRACVGAAGMIVEIFIAALALYVWVLAEQNTVRAIAFNIMLIAGMSTLVFNGNPLLRYDAYYILTDLAELPNLGQRSLAYWKYLVQRYVFRLKETEAGRATASEKAWFIFYGAASTVYRILVTVAIALFIAGEFFFIGVFLALWAVFAMAVLPLAKGIRTLYTQARAHGRGRTAGMVAAGGVLMMFVLIFVLPVPLRTQAQGVIWLSEQSMVRAGGNGFLREFIVQPGTRVKRGDALVASFDPALDAQIRLTQAKIAELEAAYSAQYVADIVKAKSVREQLLREQAALRRKLEQAAELIVRSETEGEFMAPGWMDMHGRHYRKGELLGYVTDKTRPLARVVVAQSDIDMVRLATDRVHVRMAHRIHEPLEGRIVRQVPGGGEHLPSGALALEGGGEIVVDPRDQKGTKTLERTFQFDVELPPWAAVERFGERVYVRFDHRMEPLARQWFRLIRRTFLTRFNV
jgi:putative peptide zinc metalloprotease protein